MTTTQTTTAIEVNQRIRFKPGYGAGNRWWRVQARDERYIVATVELPFGRGEAYTVVDLTGYQDRTYNGCGNGMARSSLNTIGGGWEDLSRDGCEEILAALQSGEWEFSHRRIVNVHEIEAAA